MTPRTWTCQRTTDGVRCRQVNPARNRICQRCAKRRPPKKRPEHMRALDLSYEHYVELNGGTEECGICGRLPRPGRRHARDHEHVAHGRARGLLCFQCNRLLGNKTLEWLRSAVAYLERGMT